MGFNEGFRMGLSMLDSIDASKQRAQENAWKQQQMDAWQKEQAFKEGERANFLEARSAASEAPQATDFEAPGLSSMSNAAVDGSGRYRPALDSQAAESGGPLETRRPVRLQFTPEQLQQQGLSSKLVSAAPDMRSLASLKADSDNQRVFQEGMQLRSYLNSLDEKTFNGHMQDLSDSQRNGYKIRPTKGGYVTVEVDGDNPIKMSKEQAIDWMSSRHVYNKTGDHTALARMERIDSRLAEQASQSYARSKGIADEMNDAAYKAGMLGTAQANAQANMIRAQRTGVGGGGGNRAPSGYRYSADGSKLEPIPGGPADKAGGGQGKALPTSAASGILENQRNLVRAQTALSLINGESLPGVGTGDANATGVKGYLPNQVLNRIDPQGVDTRAAIADLGSLVIHDRSGTAVTAAEFPRLAPFIPTEKDDPATVRKKLAQFVKNYQAQVDETAEFYRESGYNVPTQVFRQGGDQPPKGNQPTPTATRPPAPAKGQIYKGHRFLGGDPADRNSWEVAR